MIQPCNERKESALAGATPSLQHEKFALPYFQVYLVYGLNRLGPQEKGT